MELLINGGALRIGFAEGVVVTLDATADLAGGCKATSQIVKPGLQHLAVPAFGGVWPGEGGRNVGLCRGFAEVGDGRDYYLILAEDEAKLKWKDAVAWAKKLKIDGHDDFSLMYRREQSVAFGIAPELFKKEWHWSGEQHAGGSDYAWLQGFGNGDQGTGLKGLEYPVRAVRRVFI